MSILQQNADIKLIRPSLDNLPHFLLPPGYAMTWYAPGDEQHWVDIHIHADRYNTISHAQFVQAFGTDPALLAQRQLYLRNADHEVIGTATAWYDGDDPHTPVGRVHWVALMPAYQGRGLAKPLLAAVCHRLRELGHRSAVLTTSTARIPAINLYRQFGFVPHITTRDDLHVWRALAPHLKEPVTLPDTAPA